MSKKIKFITEIPQSDGSVIRKVHLIEFDPKTSSKIGFEYLSPTDGGPVLRPSKPPK